MAVNKINEALPVTVKFTTLSDYTLENEGGVYAGKFDKYELDALYSGTGLSRKYVRWLNLGGSGGPRTGASSWYHWEHVIDQGNGTSVWKFPVYNFEDADENLLLYDGKKVAYRGEASSEASVTFDSVFLFDGAAYTNKTTDAGTKTENNFSILADTDSYLYIGDDAVFTGATFEFQTLGQNYTLKVEYYSSAGWRTLNADDHSLTDNTEDFISDGNITWTSVGDWTTSAVDGTIRYWIRISTTTTPEVTASAYSILPGRAVPELLKLSSGEVQDEKWSWCYFESAGTPATGAAYTTIRNSGATAYEGDYYVTNSSSDANKENFFYTNHSWVTDHEDIQYDESSQALFLYSYQDHDGRIRQGKVVSISGCGLRPASALATYTYGFGISRTTPSSGANCKVQHFGVAADVLTEYSGSGVLCGDRLYLGTGSGQTTRTAPADSGQIVQLIGVAKSNEASATTAEGRVDITLHIDIDYMEV